MKRLAIILAILAAFVVVTPPKSEAFFGFVARAQANRNLALQNRLVRNQIVLQNRALSSPVPTSVHRAAFVQPVYARQFVQPIYRQSFVQPIYQKQFVAPIYGQQFQTYGVRVQQVGGCGAFLMDSY